jgi:FkbM family methyltransferase
MAKHTKKETWGIGMVRLKYWLRKLYVNYIKRDKKEMSFYNYMAGGGEELRLDYPLDESSVVVDVGGYIGDFSADLINKFNCNIDVFEPVASYASVIKTRFSSNDKVEVIQAGLGASEREEEITLEGLASSVYVDGRDEIKKEKVKIMSVIDYMNSKSYKEIDLLKINIEGGEFELLSSLLEFPDRIKKINYVQVQFHDFVPNAEEMRVEIQKLLSKTHEKMWDFPFIWESWKRI